MVVVVVVVVSRSKIVIPQLYLPFLPLLLLLFLLLLLLLLLCTEIFYLDYFWADTTANGHKFISYINS